MGDPFRNKERETFRKRIVPSFVVQKFGQTVLECNCVGQFRYVSQHLARKLNLNYQESSKNHETLTKKSPESPYLSPDLQT
jgi:hypothetical protein